MKSALTTDDRDLTRDELTRYSRHIIMPEVGVVGQRKLKTSGVLLVGAGGLGSPVAMYLAAAGVGKIGIVDDDVVDASNLQRQILHSSDSVGKSKLSSARERLRGINPYVEVELFETRLTSENALEILHAFDVVVDGADNFPTRYLVNDACVLLKKPNVYGSIFRFEGQVSVFDAEQGPCYRCLYPEPPPPGLVPSCAEGGVFGVLPGIIGTIQATEVLKLLLGIGDPLVGRLLLLDALKMQFRELRLRKNPDCPVCGSHPSIRDLIDYEEFCGIKTSRQREDEMGVPDISVEELSKRLKQHEEVFILDVREPNEHEFVNIGGLLMPLNDLPRRMEELDRSKEIVVYCRSGSRSARAAAFLQKAGFTKVKNLAGGILAWADRIDPSKPKY
ncbi:MAG: molybdopterin-synthase adenylyltransferase MoeB [Bacteroidota bacterium]